MNFALNERHEELTGSKCVTWLSVHTSPALSPGKG